MIKTVRIRNFKAIRDSKTIRFSDLAVFIGNNGSGKSSVFEALQLLQQAVTTDLTEAFGKWGGLDKIRHYGAVYEREVKSKDTPYKRRFAPISLDVSCVIDKRTYKYAVAFNTSYDGDFYVIESESLHVGNHSIFTAQLSRDDERTIEASVSLSDQPELIVRGPINKVRISASVVRYPAGRLLLRGLTSGLPRECRLLREYIMNWQFLALNAATMGFPSTVLRTDSDRLLLDPEGRNVAEYVRRLANDPVRFDSLIDKMRFVLPYASDIQTYTTDDFDRKIQLRLYEESLSRPIPGWLFSSGTLRILAMLAVLNSPQLPSVLFIDEIENGLDPRTIGLLTEEIRQAIVQHEMQVVVTTHSPYFLDLVDLKHLIVTERQGDQVVFMRPDTNESLAIWRDRFSPGKLYTMGRLTS